MIIIIDLIELKTTSPPLDEILHIRRVMYLKLLGVTFQDTPTNWDKHFDDLMERALKRMHIPRVCKNGYSIFDLHYPSLSYHVTVYLLHSSLGFSTPHNSVLERKD